MEIIELRKEWMIAVMIFKNFKNFHICFMILKTIYQNINKFLIKGVAVPQRSILRIKFENLQITVFRALRLPKETFGISSSFAQMHSLRCAVAQFMAATCSIT